MSFPTVFSPPSPSVPGSDLDPFLFGNHNDGPAKFFFPFTLFPFSYMIVAYSRCPLCFPPPPPTLPIWDCAMSSHHHCYFGPLFLQRFPLIGYPQSVPPPPPPLSGYYIYDCDVFVHVYIYMTVTFSSVSISTYYYSSFGYYTTLYSSFYVTHYFLLWVLRNLCLSFMRLVFEFYATRYLISLGFVQPVIYLFNFSVHGFFCCGGYLPCFLRAIGSYYSGYK